MRTQLYCHECGGYFNVNFDLSVNGNHIVKCPNCNHEHCRVIKNGEVTDDRWDSRNGPTVNATGYNWTTTGTTYNVTFNSSWNSLASGTSASY